MVQISCNHHTALVSHVKDELVGLSAAPSAKRGHLDGAEPVYFPKLAVPASYCRSPHGLHSDADNSLGSSSPAK